MNWSVPNTETQCYVELAKVRRQRDRLKEALEELHAACMMRRTRGAKHVPSMRDEQDAMSKARAELEEVGDE